MTSRTWLLVPSYLLGPAVWSGVADVLSGLQQFPVIPDPAPTCTNDTDHIGPWLETVLASVEDNKDLPVVVAGFDAVCPRMHLVADSLLDLGYDVEAVILVNGRFPADGLTPIEADPTTAAMLDGLVRPNDYLPPWHRWWGSMVESMLPDAELRERIFSEARAVPRSLFDQPIPAPKLPGDVGLAYLQTGEFYAACAQTARAEGWVVNRIDGEHLHLVVDPVLVACMMMTMVAQTSE